MKQTIEVDVPEGYDVDYVADPTINSGGGKRMLSIILKKQIVKDFDWYVDEYLSENDGSTIHDLRDWITNSNLSTIKRKLKASEFSSVPWEIKIGLFKFICEQLSWNYLHAIRFCIDNIDKKVDSNTHPNSNGVVLFNILPTELIEDVIKTKQKLIVF